MPELYTDFTQNIIVLGHAAFQAYADRLIVLQDDYRSGYECVVCDGEGTISCTDCQGDGHRIKMLPDKEVPTAELRPVQFKCTPCGGAGVITCPECNGKGGIIVVPENAERRPTTGTIVSVGWMVNADHWFVKMKSWLTGAQYFRRGDKVIYPSFSGHAFNLSAKDIQGREVVACIVMLRDQEILSYMYGTLEQKKVISSAALNTAA
jgi:co-chaperonin GroES (HSP10)